MNVRNQLICAHMAPLWAIVTGIGAFMMTGWIPPFSPDIGTEGIAKVFSDNQLLRVGMALTAFIAPFFCGIAVAVAVQMRRIEGDSHVLSNLQICGALIGTVELMLPPFFWLAISYRPDMNVDAMAILNDVSWFMFIGGAGPAVMQNIAIGLCVLGDKSGNGPYPRWFGYFNFWFVLTLMPGVLLPFFFRGPFSWNGIFGFWVVAIGFFVWLFVVYFMTLRAIKKPAGS